MVLVKLLTKNDQNLSDTKHDTSSKFLLENGYSHANKGRVLETVIQSLDEPVNRASVVKVSELAFSAPVDSHLGSTKKTNAVIKEQETYAKTSGPFRHGNEIPDYFKNHSNEMFNLMVGEQMKLGTLVKKLVVESTTKLDALQAQHGQMLTLMNGLSNSTFLKGQATEFKEPILSTTESGGTVPNVTLGDAMHETLKGSDPPFHDRHVRESMKPQNGEGLYRGKDPNRNQGQKYILF